MTTPEAPVGSGEAPMGGWDDDRIDAALARLVGRVVVPSTLVDTTLTLLRPGERRPWWRRIAPAAVALAVIVGVAGAGVAVIGGPGRLLGGGTLTFRDGPTADLRTLDGGEYALDFPARWLAYTAAANPGSGGSIDAILTTQAVEDRCDGVAGVDINCVYEQSLEPGQLRIFVGSGSYRAQTVLDRADIENGTTTRLAVGGMPAILDEFDVAPDDFYRADQSASWAIATPASLARVIRIEFRARDPEAAAARAAVDVLVASFRFTPPPTPLSDDPDAAVAAARAALEIQAASFRQGFVPADDPYAQTYLDCLGDVPGEAERMGVRYGPGGALGWFVTVDCSWSVTADGAGFWRIDADWAWVVEGQRGLWSETFWVGTDGVIAASSSSGEPLPIGEPSPTPEPSVVPAWGAWPPDGSTVLELPNADPNDPARVAVVDRSGELVEVRAPTAEDGYPEGPDDAFFRDPTDPGRFLLRWSTTICDREMIVTIHPDVARIVIEHAPRNGCDAMGIGRELVLEFSRDIDPADVSLEIIQAMRLPEPAEGATAMIVAMTRGDHTESIIVVDHTGSLMEARQASDSVATAETLGPGAFRVVRTDDGGTVVIWDGGLCDRDLSITIDADDVGAPDRITLNGTRTTPCRTALIRRAVWLDLGPVAIGSITAGLDMTTPAAGGQSDPGPVIEVADALLIRAIAGDDHQLRIRGWLWRDPTIYYCFVPTEPPPPLESECNGPHDRLLADPDDPTGLSLTVWFSALANGDFASVPFDEPTEVVLVGHFDDPLAEACQPSSRTGCRDVLVVDRILTANESP